MRINHILVLAQDIAAMRDFMVETIGFDEGPRPPFPFPGHWLYSDGVPQIHLAQAQANAAQGAYLGKPGGSEGTGVIDHIALTGADLPALMARIARTGADYTVRRVPADSTVQVFIPGPEGVKFEMQFPEAALSKSQKDSAA